MKILLIAPPMTQLNTPYPATAYLSGYLKQEGYDVTQRDLALDLFLALLTKKGLENIYSTIERKLIISWWGNIRFEKTFSAENCQLLAESGCIAISGGLEVASDRLLKLMKKGVTVEQVARVTKNFAENGILVHAYLMYGFPSQTEQETLDSLERVRQLMLNGCIHSAYWHRFAATIHSPIGLHPADYGIELIPNGDIQFAENDISYLDPVKTDHEMLGKGLKKALYNYMHGMGFEHSITFWFNKPLKEPDISPTFIEQAIYS